MQETWEKQCSLWGTLILAYCKHHKVWDSSGNCCLWQYIAVCVLLSSCT